MIAHSRTSAEFPDRLDALWHGNRLLPLSEPRPDIRRATARRRPASMTGAF